MNSVKVLLEYDAHDTRANSIGFGAGNHVSMRYTSVGANEDPHRLKVRLKVVAWSGFIFIAVLSLAMQMMGI
jgi:hypothetical protein